MFNSHIRVKCGVCGQELLVILRGELPEELLGQELQYHMIEHWFRGDINANDKNEIELVVSVS